MRFRNFQASVDRWMRKCFGTEISYDRVERSHRFIEESIELVQAAGLPKEDVLLLVDYVYARPSGELRQEIGGVMVTLAALCTAHSEVMTDAGQIELARILEKIDQIREKQRTKPRGPLPAYVDLKG